LIAASGSILEAMAKDALKADLAATLGTTGGSPEA